LEGEHAHTTLGPEVEPRPRGRWIFAAPDSDTTVAVISGIPSATDASNILPPNKMAETRNVINRLAASQRLIAHGLVAPNKGTSDLDEMRRQADELTISAWKGYTSKSYWHPRDLERAAKDFSRPSLGADHVLWGTDSIWWGSPHWQIEALRRFTMPESLMKRFGYRPLTPDVKALIFGLNAARVYGIDPNAHRNPVPPDYVSKLRAAYLDEGPTPSLTQYGWVLGS